MGAGKGTLFKNILVDVEEYYLFFLAVGLNSTPTPSSITLASCTPNPALTQNVYVNSTGNSVAIESTPTSSVSLYVWTPNQSYTATTMSTQQFYEAISAGLQLVGKSTSGK